MSQTPMALVEKLVGRENYNSWKFCIQTYLQHEDLWGCIENNGEVPIDAKLDMKAKSKIILLVEPVTYNVHIQEAKPPRKCGLTYKKPLMTEDLPVVSDL